LVFHLSFQHAQDHTIDGLRFQFLPVVSGNWRKCGVAVSALAGLLKARVFLEGDAEVDVPNQRHATGVCGGIHPPPDA